MRAFKQRDPVSRFSRWFSCRALHAASAYFEPLAPAAEGGCMDIRRTPTLAKQFQAFIENSEKASTALWALINKTAPAVLLPSAIGGHGKRRPEACFAALIRLDEPWPLDGTDIRQRDLRALVRLAPSNSLAAGMRLWVSGEFWNVVHAYRVSSTGGAELYAAHVRPPDTS